MAESRTPNHDGSAGPLPPRPIPDSRPERTLGRSHSHLGRFERFARKTAQLSGRPVAFFAALGIVILWLITGPIFQFSDTWQLVINTGTTVVTFLMVFLIQQSQNRDTLAVQVKLSELIIAVKGAQNMLASAEELSEHELATLHAEYCKMADEALTHLEARRGTGSAREPGHNAHAQAHGKQQG